MKYIYNVSEVYSYIKKWEVHSNKQLNETWGVYGSPDAGVGATDIDKESYGSKFEPIEPVKADPD